MCMRSHNYVEHVCMRVSVSRTSERFSSLVITHVRFRQSNNSQHDITTDCSRAPSSLLSQYACNQPEAILHTGQLLSPTTHVHSSHRLNIQVTSLLHFNNFQPTRHLHVTYLCRETPFYFRSNRMTAWSCNSDHPSSNFLHLKYTLHNFWNSCIRWR